MKGQTLKSYLANFKKDEKQFENVFQIITRLVKSYDINNVVVNGRPIFDYTVFRQPGKSVVGLYEELNSFVSFLKDSATGGSSEEMAFVLVGEPGNGKTFLVEYLCTMYREFLKRPENTKYTFQFTGMDKFDTYGNIHTIQSQTYEDPMILAMNLFGDKQLGLEWIKKTQKFTNASIDQIETNYRPLGACSEYILMQIRDTFNGKMEDVLKHIRIVPVPIVESLGTLTGKYPAKDKITSSAVDLLGEESIQRLMHITDTNNPYRFDLGRGALARVGGGGIHFSDEIYKNKKDLVQVYLGVIQNRTIELDGYKWPIDTLIVATSNNSEFGKFLDEKEEAPIIDRCRICYVSHCTDINLQKQLTGYSIGTEKKTTMGDEEIHQDPNLVKAASLVAVLSRMPNNEILDSVEMMKLAAGQVAGEKSVKILDEVITILSQENDITRRFGQKGLGQRNLGRALQLLMEKNETQTGKCMFAFDIFAAFEKIIRDYIKDTSDRTKYQKELKTARKLYRTHIKVELFNAYRDEPNAIRKDVMGYVNMIIGMDAENIGADKMWRYKNPQTGKLVAIKIDEKYINAIEDELGVNKSKETRETYRTSIRKTYGQKISINPDYDFMDNLKLVEAVTNVLLNSDISGSGSLIGALTNRTNEENDKLYNRLLKTMMNKLGYCPTCAQGTIEYFCTQDDT